MPACKVCGDSIFPGHNLCEKCFKKEKEYWDEMLKPDPNIKGPGTSPYSPG